MARYNSDSQGSIEDLFTQEGDALRRAGFREPDFSHRPAGHAALDQTTTVELVDGATRPPSPLDEALILGVDPEVYLEG